jgi:hypothetical protein
VIGAAREAGRRVGVSIQISCDPRRIVHATNLRSLIRVPDLEQAEERPFRPADSLALIRVLRRECLYRDPRPIVLQIQV